MLELDYIFVENVCLFFHEDFHPFKKFSRTAQVVLNLNGGHEPFSHNNRRERASAVAEAHS